MSQQPPATAKKKKPAYGFECSRCDKVLPSPEAGTAHLEKKHNGYGFLVWRQEDTRIAL